MGELKKKLGNKTCDEKKKWGDKTQDKRTSSFEQRCVQKNFVLKNGFKIFFKNFVLTSCFTIFCRLLQSRNNVSTFPMILCCFLSISAIKKKRVTERPTDPRTDGRTDRPSYRDVWTHLKTKKDMDFHNGISCPRFELEGWDLVPCLLI